MTREIAHVSAVEIFSSVPDQTAQFFENLMAMEVVDRRGDSVYLLSWDDYERFTVKVTSHTTSGIGRTWLRASSPEALRRRDRGGRDHDDGHRGHRPDLEDLIRTVWQRLGGLVSAGKAAG